MVGLKKNEVELFVLTRMNLKIISLLLLRTQAVVCWSRSLAWAPDNQLCLSFMLVIANWELEISRGGSIYTMETGKCYTSRLFSLESQM